MGSEPTIEGASARNQNAITHLVTVVAFDGVVLGDVSTPCDIFALARGRDGQPLYDVRICSLAPEVNPSTSAAVMREHFSQIVRTTPLAYRRAFYREKEPQSA